MKLLVDIWNRQLKNMIELLFYSGTRSADDVTSHYIALNAGNLIINKVRHIKSFFSSALTGINYNTVAFNLPHRG